jgi:membrane protease YdiL (CAAX protease family)
MHTTTYLGALFASLLGGVSFDSLMSGQISNHLTILGQGLTAGTLGVLFVFLITRFLWRRPWDWIRLHFNLRLLVYGFLIGAVMTVLTLLAVYIFGAIRIVSAPERFSIGQLIAVLLGSCGLVVFTAIAEEVVFRGMAVREWALGWGWPVAIVLGGIYFGIVHIIGLIPNIGVVDILWIIIAASFANLVFVALYMRGRSLWLPIGYHMGWNFCLNVVVGATMSGKGSPLGLWVTEISGPALVTGGTFGVEASVVTIVLSLVLSLILVNFFRSRKPGLMKPTPEENHESIAGFEA